ncbi:hypothetical protein [Caldalkalibacillus mannanilyticus]|uniref:hypothetical protein n=1 Tax=Caldalkalibacillus mannanilyticus TaxID=1418 RepID=UPI00046A7B35|nr:hypothetical protein [Caldalkalibacillus mannanilyticus]
MRGQEIVGIIMEYIHLALIGVIVLGAVFWISYVLIYQRLLGGKKRITKKEWFIGGTLTGYIIMVLGVTLFMRGSSDHGNIDFYF